MFLKCFLLEMYQNNIFFKKLFLISVHQNNLEILKKILTWSKEKKLKKLKFLKNTFYNAKINSTLMLYCVMHNKVLFNISPLPVSLHTDDVST